MRNWIVLLLWCACSCGAGSAGAAPDVTFTINEAQTFQTMDGFGGTYSDPNYTRPGEPPHNVPTATLQAIWLALHETLGFTMARVPSSVLEKGPDGIYDNDNRDPASALLSEFTMNVGPSNGNLAYVQFARQHGLATWISLGHTIQPFCAELDWLHTSFLGLDCRLDAGMEPEYAEFLDVQRQSWPVVDQHPVHGVMNEPTVAAPWGYAAIAGNQMATVVKNLGARLPAGQKIHMPDEFELSAALYEYPVVLGDAQARAHLAAFSYHAYAKSNNDYTFYSDGPAFRILNTSGRGCPLQQDLDRRAALVAMLAPYPAVHAWMTETSGLTFDTEMRGALAVSNHIFDELVFARASAFFHMSLYGQFTTSPTLDPVILRFPPEGGDLMNWWIAKSGYVFAQWNLYVRPGAVRVQVTDDQTIDCTTPVVRAVAFNDTAGARATIVALNNPSAPRSVRFTLTGSAAGVTGTSTNAIGNVQPLQIDEITANSFTVTLSAESVSSFTIPRR